MKISLIVLMQIALVLLFGLERSSGQDNKKPNIIIILSDDAGYADFGFTGSKELKTPNIDKIADEGMTFSSAYVTASVCGPSRAGLLTGKYQQRFGFIHNNVPGCVDPNAGLSGDQMGLPFSQLTIADYLKDYKSMIIGKWHQGHGQGYHPLDRGFDHFYGFLGGARSYFSINQPSPEHELWLDRNRVDEPEGYLTDHLGDKVCEFVKNNKDQPFFLYLSFNAVHSPFEAKKEDESLFVKLNAKKAYAAMMHSMDQAIGKLMHTLDKYGIDENTLVIFTNDNGDTSYFYSDNTPFSGAKSTNLEGGNRVPFIMRWKGIIPNKSGYHFPVSTLDILPTLLAISNTEVHTEFDGVNLMPFIKGDDLNRPHETLYWMVDGPFAAIRNQDWKLIEMPDRLPELYDLATDPSEKNNMALDQPELTSRLLAKLYRWKNSMAPARWQLYKKYETIAIERFDKFRK